MITVRSTPLARMRDSSISGVASLSGALAPWAHGKRGSFFQTCTCESIMRYVGSAADKAPPPKAPASRLLRLSIVPEHTERALYTQADEDSPHCDYACACAAGRALPHQLRGRV